MHIIIIAVSHFRVRIISLISPAAFQCYTQTLEGIFPRASNIEAARQARKNHYCKYIILFGTEKAPEVIEQWSPSHSNDDVCNSCCSVSALHGCSRWDTSAGRCGGDPRTPDQLYNISGGKTLVSLSIVSPLYYYDDKKTDRN